MKNRKLQELIQSFTLKQTDSFALDELMKHVQKFEKGFDAEARLYEQTCESDWLFEDERDPIHSCFMPRHCFFKGAEFRVIPLREEVEGGFLVPGHRFVPFIARNMFPASATLKLPDGSAVTTRIESFSGKMAIKFMLFYGEFGMISYLINDDKSNADAFAPPYEKLVNMTVFDMQAFFKQSGFKSGDSLMLRVEDWRQGVFSVRHIPVDKRSVDFAGAHEWVDALRDRLDELRFDDDYGHDCYEQAARMFWLAEVNKDLPSIISNPPLALSGFFNMQKDLSVQTIGQIGFFWPDDEPVENRLKDLMDSDDIEPETELDGFFQLLGLSMDSDDAEAYMCDALARGENDPDAILAHVISGRSLFFPTKEDENEFNLLWGELWDEVCGRYDPEKDVHKEMRSVFIDLNDQCLQVLRELDGNMVSPSDVATNPVSMQLGELSAMIHSMLVMSTLTDENAEEFPFPLDEMKHKVSAMIADMGEQLHEGCSTGISAVAGDPVYQLKISLKCAKPPIWRRVLVPSGMELEELHSVIQVVFGWRNCHLHQFIDGRTYYLTDGEDDGFSGMTVEESGVRLQDLLRREKDKIVYEYDFGDSWEHEVLLEKVLAPNLKKPLPLCVKGKRACPPEDCGGIPGYYHLLETLSGADCEEKEELLEWLGGPLEPEAFDLIGVNAQLREWF